MSLVAVTGQKSGVGASLPVGQVVHVGHFTNT